MAVPTYQQRLLTTQKRRADEKPSLGKGLWAEGFFRLDLFATFCIKTKSSSHCGNEQTDEHTAVQ
ncbi:hypothetical protein [Mucilaginibacter terrenus]|nr:hypothetical protein [Mucilaginibacter terrenus]